MSLNIEILFISMPILFIILFYLIILLKQILNLNIYDVKEISIISWYTILRKIYKDKSDFFCVVILINFFEEIRFSEKYNTELIVHNLPINIKCTIFNF